MAPEWIASIWAVWSPKIGAWQPAEPAPSAASQTHAKAWFRVDIVVTSVLSATIADETQK
jgi:hypothetical protein